MVERFHTGINFEGKLILNYFDEFIEVIGVGTHSVEALLFYWLYDYGNVKPF